MSDVDLALAFQALRRAGKEEFEQAFRRFLTDTDEGTIIRLAEIAQWGWQRRVSTWVTQHGDEIPYADLSDHHLYNMSRGFRGVDLAGVRRELEWRGIDPDQEIEEFEKKNREYMQACPTYVPVAERRRGGKKE